MDRAPRGDMDTTMKANAALGARLAQEGLSQGLDVRPTYAPIENRGADGEITVYRSGMVQLVGEIVQPGEDAEAVADRIVAKVKAALPASRSSETDLRD